MSEETSPPERVRSWYNPKSIVGAYVHRKYEADKGTRELVAVVIQGGAVGISLVLCFLIYVLVVRVGDVLVVQTKALNDHLDEDLKEELAGRVADRLMRKDPAFQTTEDGRVILSPAPVPQPTPVGSKR